MNLRVRKENKVEGARIITKDGKKLPTQKGPSKVNSQEPT